MQTLSFNGEPTELENILALDELQSKNIITIRFGRWIGWEGEPGNSPIIDKGGRIDIDVADIQTPVIFKTEIHATDFLVSSRDIKDDPNKDFLDALLESGKAKGEPKSLDLISRSALKALERAREEIASLKQDTKTMADDIKDLKKKIK